MSKRTGQETGQPAPGLGWAEYLALLVEEHGTLTAVAWQLIGHAAGDDVANVERALRRLRTRGQRDGGAWGQRLVRRFGMPRSIVDRLRWLGFYHSPFSDLPLGLCLDQLRLWDRPPISTSRARVFLHLGMASAALRQRQLDVASRQLDRAEAVADAADQRLEAALQRAYIASRESPAATTAALDRAAALVDDATLAPADRVCFAARLTDQRAFLLNRQGAYAEALALYRALPDTDEHPFASYRRAAGIAYGLYRTGDPDSARTAAERACRHAGDGGYLRLRAMGLLLLYKVATDDDALARASAIAERLADDELRARVRHQRSDPPR